MTKPLIVSLFRENQHAMASVTMAVPPTFVIITLITSGKGDPSKRLTTNDGKVINAKPVDPSKNAVTIKNPFKELTLVSIYRA
jgi:hypothetical protein